MSYHTPRRVVLVPFTAILIILVPTLLCDIVNKPLLLPVNYTAHKSVSLNYYCWYLCGMMNVTWDKRVLNKSSKQVSSVSWEFHVIFKISAYHLFLSFIMFLNCTTTRK